MPNLVLKKFAVHDCHVMNNLLAVLWLLIWCLSAKHAVLQEMPELSLSDNEAVGDETVEAPSRSTQLRRCSGCLLSHNHHTWGMSHKDCKGPAVGFVSAGSETSEAFDIGLSQSSGLCTVGSGDDFQRKHGIPNFEFDDFGISCLTPSRNFKRDYDLVSDKEPKVLNKLMTLMARTNLMKKQFWVTACSSWRSRNIPG